MSPGTRIKLLFNNIIKVSLPLLLISCPVGFTATRHRQINRLSRSDANISTSINNAPTSNSSTANSFQPDLTNDRLLEIKLYDRMKCFPRLLCTLTKADAFTKLGEPVNLNELADGYLKLLSAFPGGPPKDIFTRSDGLLSFKDDFLGNDGGEVGLTPLSNAEDQNSGANSESSASDSSEEKKKRQKTRDEEGNKEESEEMLLTDPLLHQKEKVEMNKLMDELIAEEKKDGSLLSSGLGGSASAWDSIPMQIGASLLKSVVIPYLTGDASKRRKRDLSSHLNLGSRRSPRNSRRQEAAIKQAMNLWSGLKSVKQCTTLYPSCPFEAWQVVSMINLITPKE